MRLVVLEGAFPASCRSDGRTGGRGKELWIATLRALGRWFHALPLLVTAFAAVEARVFLPEYGPPFPAAVLAVITDRQTVQQPVRFLNFGAN